MTLSTTCLCGLSSALTLLGLSSPAGAEVRHLVPRYRLKVGQELKYHGTNDFKYDNGSFGRTTDWQVWVVRTNDDGSWRLVLRSSDRKSQPSDGRDRDAGEANVTMAYCDLFPDGRIVANDSFGFRLDPSPLFPSAPQGRRTRRRTAGRRRTPARAPAPNSSGPVTTGKDRDEWVFDGVRRSPMDKIYLSTSQARYVFDGERAWSSGSRARSTQGYGFNGKGTGTIELTAVEEQDAGKVEAFARRRIVTSRRTGSTRAPGEGEQGGQGGRMPCSPGRSDPQGRPRDAHSAGPQGAGGRAVEGPRADGLVLCRGGEEPRRGRGYDAAEWETKDLEGKPHSLKDYRGKVVILDFWYRGCGWCIRAMPQVKELAEDFRDEPVAVLGMNTDRKEEDARFVVEEMGLNYPNLKAEGLPEKYRVRGFPTLIIIDQEGKVADIHVGYSPTLREEVAKTVRGLLDTK